VRVYIAASSTELELAEWYMLEVRKLGHEITYDWTRNIRAVGLANPTDWDLARRFTVAERNAEGIQAAACFWAILPMHASLGVSWELGYASALHWRMGEPNLILISGDWRSTVFSGHGTIVRDTHVKALEVLQSLR
jgi:hypothetical protein